MNEEDYKDWGELKGNVQATCPLHNTPMEEKNGKYGPYFSHKTTDGYCNGTKITPFKKPIGFAQGTSSYTAPTTRQPLNDGRNEDQIARGKVRFGYVNTVLRVQGIVRLTAEDKQMIEELVDYTMSGN